MPKPSTLSTRLAKARTVTGLKQTELSKLTGIPLNQLKRLENGDYELSAKYAAAVSRQIGVSGAWLLGFGSSEDPVNLRGQPFTRDDYEQVRGAINYGDYASWVRYRSGELESNQRAHHELLLERSQAWRAYLEDLTGAAVKSLAENPALVERLGVEVSTAIRHLFDGCDIPLSGCKYASVDDAAQKLNLVTKPSQAKRSKPAPDSPGQS
jgi:transcriptional regulator with XRE-family HTH domain